MIQSRYLLLGTFFVLGSVFTAPILHADKHESPCQSHGHSPCHGKQKSFKHNIQLYLADSLGFPVPGTEFWVTIDVIKDGPLVTLQLPLINFQTLAAASPNNTIGDGIVPGGYLYTSDGFLPKELRPNDLVPRSIVAASNNGGSPVFSFTQDVATLPQPPAGYIVSVTEAGALQVQAAGTFGNIIPVGPQILMPCSITYLAKSEQRFAKNIKISAGKTDISQFTGPSANNGIRDTHVNDAYKGIVAFTWTDNAGYVNLNNGVLNAVVAVGKVVNGELVVNAPINLTNFPDSVPTPTNQGILAWCTSVAINRTNPKNIVVSWSQIDRTNFPTRTGLPYRAVSFDGGQTWPYNGLMNIVPTDPAGIGDCLGVYSDKYGNIWYSTSSRFNDEGEFTNQPYWTVSTDGGITFSLAFTVPEFDPDLGITDYPQYCFGDDGFGNYGLWYQTTIYQYDGDVYPNFGFLPIPGPLTPADLPIAGSFVSLRGLNNSITEGGVAASSDGRVWFQGYPNCFGASSYIQPQSIAFKSPGIVDENWCGSWNLLTSNDISNTYFGFVPPPIAISYPVVGYFANVSRGVVYDEKREALYALNVMPSPDYSQDYQISFMISRDNGMTWSDPIFINNTDFANRGYFSMALDEVTGDLVFGWYDGRNDLTYHKLEYFGTVLLAKELDKLVKAIPLSNPTFQVPSAQ